MLAAIKVALQEGNVGYYAEVELHAEWTQTSQLNVVLPQHVQDCWKEAIAFGCRYALEKIPVSTKKGAGLVVTVSSLRGHAVDTTSEIVAYATSLAVWKSLEVVPTRSPIVDMHYPGVLFSK